MHDFYGSKWDFKITKQLSHHKSGPTWPKNVKVAQKLTFLSKIIGPQRLLSIHIDGGNDKQSKLLVLGDVLT